jgi:hypothetical protein
MTLTAHLKRDPGLVNTMLYHADLLWGLAWLNLKPDGRKAIAELLRVEAASLPDLLTQMTLCQLASELLQRAGAEAALDCMQSLARLGFQAARDSGASYSPFFASHIHLPPMPETEDADRWLAYREEATEAMMAGNDFSDPTFGPQLLAAKIRERNRQGLPWLVAPRGLTRDAGDQLRIVRHTQLQGWTPEEAFACVAGARRGFAEIVLNNEITPSVPTGWNVLTRARRARYPGIVFARAAASGEVDPLDDVIAS